MITQRIDTFIAECGEELKTDSNWQQLVEHEKLASKHRVHDVLAKRIMSHEYGIRIAIKFRNWVRSKMDPSEELSCGGSTVENYDVYMNENFKGVHNG